MVLHVREAEFLSHATILVTWRRDPGQYVDALVRAAHHGFARDRDDIGPATRCLVLFGQGAVPSRSSSPQKEIIEPLSGRAPRHQGVQAGLDHETTAVRGRDHDGALRGRDLTEDPLVSGVSWLQPGFDSIVTRP